MNTLTEHQTSVAAQVLEHESKKRDHVVVALSGAHAYGFPSPNSDLDLKAVHIAPTRAWLGLDTPSQPADRLEVIEGVEIDYTSNELGGVVAGVLGGNGNYLERVLGALVMQSSPWHEGLRRVCAAAISRRYHHHYGGFARHQLHRLEADERPPAKRALYVLRTALTGTHLLRTGDLVVDVRRLLDTYGFGDARELIEAKRAGELVALEPSAKAHWLGRLTLALGLLDEAREESPLPPEAPNRVGAEAWLVDTRVAALAG